MKAQIIVFIIIAGVLIPAALVASYLLGRYQNRLLARIRELEQPKAPEPEAPQVTLGVYAPATMPNEGDGRDVGVVETKTPQRVAWEAAQAIEKEGLTGGLHRQ